MTARRSSTTRKAATKAQAPKRRTAAARPADVDATPGQLVTDAGGRPAVDAGGRPIVAGGAE